MSQIFVRLSLFSAALFAVHRHCRWTARTLYNCQFVSGDVDVFVQNLARDSMMSEDCDRTSLVPLHLNAQETAHDVEVLVHVRAVFFAESAGVFVGCRSAGILAHTRARVDGNVLPVSVAADDIHVFLAADEVSKFVAFMREAHVGMVVVLVSAIRADNRSRTDEDAECGIGRLDGVKEPLLLCPAPDRFLRAVRCRVGASKVTAFDKPDLQVFSPSVPAREIARAPVPRSGRHRSDLASSHSSGCHDHPS